MATPFTAARNRRASRKTYGHPRQHPLISNKARAAAASGRFEMAKLVRSADT